MRRLLLVDDEESLRNGLGRLLRALDFDVVTADGPRGLQRVGEESFDIIITDLRMPSVNGFDIISAARRHSPSTPIIAMSGSAEIPDAVRAMRAGARDFLIKPFEITALEEAINNVFGFVEKTPGPYIDPLQWRDRHAPFLLGDDPAMLPVLAMISQVADTNCTVLLSGESGTGKEVAARALVAGSPRADKKFVPVNCAAIASNLVESELFGHVKGSFTGAISTRAGFFGQADKGTIFLDEIGDMEMNVQAKLLRVIQDGHLHPVGQEDPMQVDVRVIAATNHDLPAAVAAGRFRDDLFWRLNVIPIELPPLRARTSDIPVLVDHFLKRANETNRRSVDGIEPAAVELLRRHTWPGNIRELQNLVGRMVILKGSGTITARDLPANLRQAREVTPISSPIQDLPSDGTDLRGILEAVEDKMIAEALDRTGGNKNKAAELLGLNRTTLVEKLRRKRLVPTVV